MMLAQSLHHLIADSGVDLNHHAQFFGKQCLQRQLLAPHANLACPVLAVADFHPAVSDAVTFDQQHVDVQRHANIASEGHLADAGKQSAVAAVVVGHDLVFSPQCIDGVDQIDQVLRVIQIGYVTVFAIERLCQDAAAHAVLALAQINQDQRRVWLVPIELRSECAAHIGQSDKGADDQRHRGRDFFTLVVARPRGAHRQRIFADRNRYAKRRAQLHTYSFDSFKQRGVLARLATSSHPVG